MSNASEIWPQLQQRIVELAESGRTDAVELLLAEYPDIRSDSKLLLDCIHAEYSVWERRGQAPNLTDYARRFPEYADSLQALFASRAVESRQSVLDDTYVPPGRTAQTVSGRIGRYEIIQEIARGGMGVVYKAFDQQLDRMVAVKLIKSGELADQEQVQRFRVEAQAAAQLHHSGIVPVYEVGQHESQHFLVMEFVEGRSLTREVAEAPLEPRTAARVMQQIAEAVQYAHDCGIIHRDLKPENILLATDDRPRVLDFGLAKRQKKDSSLTETGQILGTPSYMSPEQAQGMTDQIGHLSDVYSLGATFYYLLTGRPPFRGTNQFETILQVVNQEPIAPKQLNSSIPHDLETICLKCLQKRPEQRYGSAQAFADDLGSFLRYESIQARRPSRMSQAWRWVKRRRVAALIIGLLVIQGTALIVWYTRQNVVQPVKPQPDDQREVSPSAESKLPSDSGSHPARDLVIGDSRTLFNGRNLTGWNVMDGSVGVDTVSEIGHVLRFERGLATCVLADWDYELLKNFRLKLTVYPHGADKLTVEFAEVRDENDNRGFLTVELSPEMAVFNRMSENGRQTKRLFDLVPYRWKPDTSHVLVIEQQHDWWFVTVDDSQPVAIPKGKVEPLKLFRFRTGGTGAAWLEKAELFNLIKPPKSR